MSVNVQSMISSVFMLSASTEHFSSSVRRILQFSRLILAAFISDSILPLTVIESNLYKA